MSHSIQRVALITGCGKKVGIGSATARELAAAGIAVAVSDIEDASPGLDGLVDEIRAGGGTAMAVRGDVSSEGDVVRMFEQVAGAFGRLDILVNNAAAPHGQDRGDITTVPVEAWDRVMAINARGAFLMCRAAVTPMRAQGWGRIINIASITGVRPFPRRGAYSASKAAVIGFTRSLSLDLAASGITVNAIVPGSIRTSRAISTATAGGNEDAESALHRRAQAIPMKRHGEVSEIAGAIRFLTSDASAYMTGQTMVIDGGGLPMEW